MTIPAMFIFVIIYDRSTRADQISNQIAFAAGGAQKIVEPVLAIPVETIDSDGIWSTDDTIFVFADNGEVLADVAVSTKKKSLYSVQVYESDLSFKAKFDLGKLQGLSSKNKKVLINQALVLLQVSDLRGALSDAELTLEDGTKHIFSPKGLKRRGYGDGQYISASIPNLTDHGIL